MTAKKRTLAILVAVMMVITMMPLTAQAASTANVYMKVKQDNAKAKQILKYVNKERSKRGLRKLKLDKSLTNAAVARAAEVSILVPSTSPHKRPNGRIAKTINKRVNYECCLESVGWTPKQMVRSWMTSKSHKKGILLKSAKSIGISYATTVDGYQIATLEISNSKARSIMKSNSKKTVTKKVAAKKKLLKKGYFKIRNASTMTAGASSTAKVIYDGPKTYGPGLVAAKSFKWSSSNSSVAAVSSAGKITAKKAGTVTIKAKMKTGYKFTITKKITVKAKSNGTKPQTETYEQKVLKNRKMLYDFVLDTGTADMLDDGTDYYYKDIKKSGYNRPGVAYRLIAFPENDEMVRLQVLETRRYSYDSGAESLGITQLNVDLALNSLADPNCEYIYEYEPDETITDEQAQRFSVKGSLKRKTFDGSNSSETFLIKNVDIEAGDELTVDGCREEAVDYVDGFFADWKSRIAAIAGSTDVSMYTLGFELIK